MDVYQEYNKK